MKKILTLLLLTASLSAAANYDLRYLQENASGKIVERTVTLTPSTFLSVSANGTLQVQSSAAFGAALTSMNATQLTSGTLPDARLSDAAIVTGTVGSSTSTLQLQIDSKGRVTNAFSYNLGTLATQNGTFGNATQLTSGTLPAARLPGLTLNLSGTLHNTPVNFTAGVGNATLANQTANTVFAGPSSGNATTPTFRSLVNADIPSSLSLSGTLSNNGTATFGDAAADDFVATDDDPRFPNLTAATYTAAADNKVAINGDVGDARYGQLFVLRNASDLTSNSTSYVESSESIVVPAGLYHVQTIMLAVTASGTSGVQAECYNTTTSHDTTGFQTRGNSVTQDSAIITTTELRQQFTTAVRSAGSCLADGGSRTAANTASMIVNISTPSTIRLRVAQRTATDAANPAILRAGSFSIWRKLN